MAESIFKFDENYKPRDSRSSVSPQQDKHTHSHMLTKTTAKDIIKLLKTSDKKKRLKAAGGKKGRLCIRKQRQKFSKLLIRNYASQKTMKEHF